MPGVQLEACVPVNADLLKAEGFVQRNACRIRQRDNAVGVPQSLLLQKRQQPSVQSAPDAATTELLRNIDRDFHRPGIGGPVTM